jgi:hypothetical protein
MSTNSFFAKSLRFIGILLMGLTGGFTLLGGIGTTCAALFPANYTQRGHKLRFFKAAIPNLNLTISTPSRQDAKILTFPRRNRQEYHLAQGQS